MSKQFGMLATARHVPYAPGRRVETDPAQFLGMMRLQQDNRYLGYPPPDMLPRLHQLILTLPSVCFDELDLEREELQVLLNQIKNACKVWIVVKNDVEGMVTLWAEERGDFADALWKIHSLLSLSGSGRSRGTFFPLFLVEVPSTQPDATKVMLVSTSDGRRAVVQQNPAEHLPLSNADTRRAARCDQIKKAIAEVAGELRKVPAEMRMRVHFGCLSLTQSHKDKHLYSLHDFEAFARQVGRRGCSKMDLNIGDERFSGQLLESVFESTAIFEPEHTRIFRMQDTPAHQFVVIFARGYRIEIPIQKISTGPSQTKINCGSPRAFDHIGRDKEIEITTLCPERHHDWKVEVLTELARLPRWANELISHIRFVQAEGEDKFPTPQIAKDVLHQYGVEMLAGKTIWKVRMQHTSYLVEISLYREWSRADTKCIKAKSTNTRGTGTSIKGTSTQGGKGSKPEDINTKSPLTKFCGVTMYCDEWEDEMRFRNLADQPRDWGEDNKKLFRDVPAWNATANGTATAAPTAPTAPTAPAAGGAAGGVAGGTATGPPPGYMDGYAAFLKMVDHLHDVLDSIDPVNRTGPVSTPEGAPTPAQDLLGDIQESITEQPLESQGAGSA